MRRKVYRSVDKVKSMLKNGATIITNPYASDTIVTVDKEYATIASHILPSLIEQGFVKKLPYNKQYPWQNEYRFV